MSLFHKHQWKEIVRTYQPSEAEVARKLGVDRPFEWKWDFDSYTTILWECKNCHKLKDKKLLGKAI